MRPVDARNEAREEGFLRNLSTELDAIIRESLRESDRIANLDEGLRARTQAYESRLGMLSVEGSRRAVGANGINSAIGYSVLAQGEKALHARKSTVRTQREGPLKQAQDPRALAEEDAKRTNIAYLSASLPSTPQAARRAGRCNLANLMASHDCAHAPAQAAVLLRIEQLVRNALRKPKPNSALAEALERASRHGDLREVQSDCEGEALRFLLGNGEVDPEGNPLLPGDSDDWCDVSYNLAHGGSALREVELYEALPHDLRVHFPRVYGERARDLTPELRARIKLLESVYGVDWASRHYPPLNRALWVTGSYGPIVTHGYEGHALTEHRDLLREAIAEGTLTINARTTSTKPRKGDEKPSPYIGVLGYLSWRAKQRATHYIARVEYSFTREEGEGVYEYASPLRTESTALESVMADERTRRVCAYITSPVVKRLCPQNRAILLVLLENPGLSAEEVATVIGCKRKAVYAVRERYLTEGIAHVYGEASADRFALALTG